MAIRDPNRIWTLTMHAPSGSGAPPLFEHATLKHEARLLGVENHPGEGHEDLCERIEAVKAGDARACSVSTWEPVRVQRARVAEEAAKIAIASGAPPWEVRDAIEKVSRKYDEEIRRRKSSGVFSGSMSVGNAPSGTPIRSTSAPTYRVRSDEAVFEMVERQAEEDIRVHLARIERTSPRIPHAEAMARLGRWTDVRAENRRVGEDIAKNPPEWAYPLAWRLAVMAVIEAYNNTETVVPFDMRYWEQKIAPSLRAYHQARLDGLLPDPAMMKSVRGGREPLDKDVVEKLYDGIACQAYERGRPGPGGVR